jgi:hypothetical protein
MLTRDLMRKYPRGVDLPRLLLLCHEARLKLLIAEINYNIMCSRSCGRRSYVVSYMTCTRPPKALEVPLLGSLWAKVIEAFWATALAAVSVSLLL